jgi:hypothetical protein
MIENGHSIYFALQQKTHCMDRAAARHGSDFHDAYIS